MLYIEMIFNALALRQSADWAKKSRNPFRDFDDKNKGSRHRRRCGAILAEELYNKRCVSQKVQKKE